MEGNQEIGSDHLVIAGKVSATTLAGVHDGLNGAELDGCVPCFVWFSPRDYPVGSEFDLLFARGNPTHAVQATAKIMAVTQQYAKPFDCVPRGWKTICLIHFSAEAKPLIDQLATIDSWYGEGRIELCLAQKGK